MSIPRYRTPRIPPIRSRNGTTLSSMVKLYFQLYSSGSATLLAISGSGRKSSVGGSGGPWMPEVGWFEPLLARITDIAIRIQTQKSSVIMMPGMTPPRNNLPMEDSVAMP